MYRHGVRSLGADIYTERGATSAALLVGGSDLPLRGVGYRANRPLKRQVTAAIY